MVVVTKGQTLEVARAVIEAGATILGENYPEEGAAKIESLSSALAVEWHMIGHVQSRKANLAIRHYRLVHSLDSLKLARIIDRLCADAGRQQQVLIEVNVGGEASKHGWPAADEAAWPALVDEFTQILALRNLQVQGLMAMPPLGDSAESSRPYFARVRRLQEFLLSRILGFDCRELSIGTSFDYEVAVEEGATLVRVGTAIVGQRAR